MKPLLKPQLRVTLQVGAAGAWMCWSMGRQGGCLPVATTGSSPKEHLNAAADALAQALKNQGITNFKPTHLHWRLVIPGGFYAMASRVPGRWTRNLATAAAAELESVCPVPLDDLVATAIPLGHKAAWVCALPRTTLEAWAAAARLGGHHLEGIWTCGGALVDYLLEQPAIDEPLFWQDGQTRVDIAATAPDPATASSAAIERIRVHACRDAPATSIRPFLANCSDIPEAFLPALAAHALTQIDPTESLNQLGVDKEMPSALQRRRQNPLAAGILACAVALGLFAGANLVAAGRADHQAQAAQAQISAVWRQNHGLNSVPVLPVTTLEQEVRSLQSLDERQRPTAPPRSVLSLWALLVAQAPAEIELSVSSVRLRQGELWVEGKAQSQAEARKIEAAWSKLPGLKADPFRLSSGSGAMVNYSVRMVVR